MKYRIAEMQNGDFNLEWYNENKKEWCLNESPLEHILRGYSGKRHYSFKSYYEAKECLDRIQKDSKECMKSITYSKIHDQIEVD
jgi:hypothetical protein